MNYCMTERHKTKPVRREYGAVVVREQFLQFKLSAQVLEGVIRAKWKRSSDCRSRPELQALGRNAGTSQQGAGLFNVTVRAPHAEANIVSRRLY